MKIEYSQTGRNQWQAALNGQVIAQIGVLIIGDEEGIKAHCYARDLTQSIPEPTEGEDEPEPNYIPGSPFASVNQAKAAMEYHFRNLTETA